MAFLHNDRNNKPAIFGRRCLEISLQRAALWGSQQNEIFPHFTNGQNIFLQILTYYKILYNQALITGAKSKIKTKSSIELYWSLLKGYSGNYR